MLTFEEKLAIFESFPELTKKEVSLGRLNFQFEDSVFEKKNIVYHLHKNGNGFVFAGEINGYRTDEKGLVNIRDFEEHPLRCLIAEAIRSLSPREIDGEEEPFVGKKETWMNGQGQILSLVQEEEDVWSTYGGENLDGTFNSFGEAKEYLIEEGFRRI